MVYLIYQREKCPKTEKLHWQGFVILKKPARLAGAKKIIDDQKAHLEKAIANDEKNIKYCSKEESRVEGPYEFGEKPHQGERTDLKESAKLAIEGKFKEIEPVHYMRYHKGIEKLHELHSKPKVRTIEVTVIHGPTGTGKSHMANELAPNAYWKPPGQWWDGYNGDTEVVIDEFDPKEHNINDVLRWMDKWPLKVPIKGGFKNYCCEKLIITSHFNPEEWYPLRKDEIMRRVKHNPHLVEAAV